MFRKIWKTIKILLIIIVILICVPHSLLPKKESDKSTAKSNKEHDVRNSNAADSDTTIKFQTKKNKD
jgi:uncharacterized protein YpmB